MFTIDELWYPKRDLKYMPISLSRRVPFVLGDFGDSGSANTIYRIEEPYINGKQHISVQSTLKFR